MPDTITTAVPQQSPPANAIQHPAKVYLLSRRLPDIVHLVQYDQTLPVLAVELLQGDAPYTVPEGAAVNIRMAKPVPSSKKVYNPAYGISSDRHTVYIQVTPQMTVVAGCTNPVIEVVVDGGVACTGTLRLEIDPNPVQESDIIDTDEYLSIQEILAQVQEAAKVVQDNEQALQDVHNNLAAIQQAASNAQAAANSAEKAADSAEKAQQEAQKALGFRSYFGGQVVPDADGDLNPSRPMSTPTAASVTIKARGDRIAGLTMAGKTTQEGTGDPSPDNVRMISGVGMYDQCVVFDGSEDEGWIQAPQQLSAFSIASTFFMDKRFDVYSIPATKMNSMPYGGLNWGAISDGEFGVSQDASRSYIFLKDSRFSNVADFKSYLSQHPLTLWYKSVDYYKSTGPFYTVVELSGDPYRAVGFELNQPLFDGDSLKVGGKSGFDKMVVLDGSADEQLLRKPGGKEGFYYFEVTTSVAPVIPQSAKIVGQILSDLYPALPTDMGYRGVKSVGIASNGKVCIFDPNLVTETALRNNLAAHPLTIFYRSVNYTPEADIAVALESHVQAVLVLDGTTTVTKDSSGYISVAFPSNVPAPKGTSKSTNLCSIAKFEYSATANGFYVLTPVKLVIFGSAYVQAAGWTSGQDCKTYLTENPATLVYELATPITYARPVPTMIAQPGEDGTFTVTGENSLSVLLKAFQDGGDAATIEGHTWADIQKLISDAVTSAIALSK